MISKGLISVKDIIKRILKLISSAIFAFLVLLIILILVYIIRVRFLAGSDRLGEVKTNFYTILTQSMYPTIKAGDIVITYKEDENKYNVGDVITFVSSNNGGITITHRVKEVYEVNGEYSYKTKGDNNNTADNEIIKSQSVLGKVVFKIPKAGYIQQFLSSKFGWIVAIVLPALAIIISDIVKLFRSIGGNKYNKYLNTERAVIARKELEEVVNDDEAEE